MATKWKYQHPEKRQRYRDYSNKLYIDKNKTKKFTINNWEFLKGSGAGPVFKCYVEKEDGEVVDKTWAIWDLDFAEVLKKKLKGKKPPSDKVELKVVKHGENFEETFELK